MVDSLEALRAFDRAVATAAIILWNMVYLSCAKRRDLPVDDNLLERLSPLVWRQKRREVKPACPALHYCSTWAVNIVIY